MNKIFTLTLLLLTATGCTEVMRANMSASLDKAMQESHYRRTPFKSTYMHRLAAEQFCEERANKRTNDMRVQIALKLDCMHDLEWF